MLEIKIKKLNEKAILPVYKSEGASGMDLYACIEKPIMIKSGQIVLIPTGISIEIPNGYEAQIRPRSGLALNYGITVLNSPGTIDSDYRGEIKIILINLSEKDFLVKHGMRIAQMVFSKIERVRLIIDSKLSKTNRGEGGFGHTGIN